MKRVGSNLVKKDKHAMVECPKCGNTMKSDKLLRHLLTHNDSKECRFCKKSYRSDRLLKHEALCQSAVDETMCDRRTGASPLDDCDSTSSISGFFRSIELHIDSSNDYDNVLDAVCNEANPRIVEYVAKYPVKAQLVLKLSFYKERVGEKEEAEKVFRSICEPIRAGDMVEEFLQRSKLYIKARIEEYERQGSGWIYEKFQCAHLDLAKYNPLSASGTVVVPKKVKDMKSVLNITSNDNKCFLYSLAAGVMKLEGSLPKKNATRYTNYVSRASAIVMDNVEFPVKIKDISKVEEMNGISISVFQWCLEEDCAIPLKHGSGNGVHVDLLYIKDEHTAHYMLIKDFNAFMRHRTSYHHSMFYCRKCLHGFTVREKQEEHSLRCLQGVNQIVKVPEEGFIEFKGVHKLIMKPFIVYFDFECITAPYDSCKTNPEKKSTEKYQKHIPVSFCIITTSQLDSFEEETIVYSSEDPDLVIGVFIENMHRIHGDMMQCLEDSIHKIDMTDQDQLDFKSSTHCYLCKKKLEWGSLKNYPVRDHNHFVEKNNYRGAACNTCNRNYWNRTKKVPAIAHNMKGYDLNLFLIDLIKTSDKIEVIPETIEKFKAVFTENFTFLDSYAFLSSSLAQLAENLKKTGTDKFYRLREEFPDHCDLLSSKGVYFYDYANSFDVFSETELPPKESFYSRLREEHISDQDYERAQDVFKSTGCKNLLDYMELYVRTDTAILCDVFENFRNLCKSYYDLDCCHYTSLPGFAWDAMLKMTSVKIEYITDLEMYTFIEENLRGGVTTINHRYFKANNEYLDDYDSSKPTSSLHYVDANNLYGKGMELPLPTGNYQWLSVDEIKKLDLLSIDPDGDTCYILEVDLEYPREIHDRHNDYPLAARNRTIDETEVSPYNRAFLDRNEEKFKPSEKLCPDLYDKEEYVCSLKNLQLFLQQGMKLKGIRRVFSADQSPFLAPYIKFNSEKRLASTSKFESDFFKFANNSIYGKTIESLRNRTNVDIVKEPGRAKKLTSKPQFKGFQILDEDITVVQSVKRSLTLNKPIACGFIVLENAKNIMGDFWYNTLKEIYDDKIKLILSDTDSFVYAVQTEDGYQDLYNIRNKMDLSGYDKSTPLGKFHDPSNKKVPGMFSDERPKEIIREVVALKPKMYSLLTKKLTCDQKTGNPDHDCTDACVHGSSITAKGITKSAQRRITHEDYKSCLNFRETTDNTGTQMTVSNTIRSYGHKLYSISINKRGLSAYDDKKYICDDGISTLSHGNYNIPRRQ